MSVVLFMTAALTPLRTYLRWSLGHEHRAKGITPSLVS